jgi:hypothetical protein
MLRLVLIRGYREIANRKVAADLAVGHDLGHTMAVGRDEDVSILTRLEEAEGLASDHDAVVLREREPGLNGAGLGGDHFWILR